MQVFWVLNIVNESGGYNRSGIGDGLKNRCSLERVGSSPTTRIGVKFCCDSNFQLCFILSVRHNMNHNSVSYSAVADDTLMGTSLIGRATIDPSESYVWVRILGSQFTTFVVSDSLLECG